MNTTSMCPACLADLPAGYPYDHVAIDEALGCHPDWARPLYRALTVDERGELVRVALSRGFTINALTRRFGQSCARLRQLAALPAPATTERIAA